MRAYRRAERRDLRHLCKRLHPEDVGLLAARCVKHFYRVSRGGVRKSKRSEQKKAFYGRLANNAACWHIYLLRVLGRGRRDSDLTAPRCASPPLPSSLFVVLIIALILGEASVVRNELETCGGEKTGR
jgi:hypothetical protein